MPWTKTANVAMYEGADWSGLKQIVSDCTPQQAQRIAILDPTIRFFFFARESMVLTNPDWPEPKVFQPGDAVFFSGESWWGSAPQCDSYQRDGLSLAYIGNLGPNPTSPLVAADYVTAQGLNAVDIVSLFAANLNVTVFDDYVRLAPDVKVPTGGTLAVAHQDYIPLFQQSVAALQEQGLIVLLTFLNNHDAAGWSEFDPDTAAGQADAQTFAQQLQAVVETYGFDGIDIDDEYSDGAPYPASLAMVTSMMQALMPGKLISKALFDDSDYFGPTYDGVGLAQTLTYGWQMSYGASPSDVLPAYVGYGMSQQALSMGFWTGQPSFDPSGDVAWLKSNGYAGVKDYAFEDSANQALLGSLVNDWMGPGNWNRTS
jgi:hypothetical protein